MAIASLTFSPLSFFLPSFPPSHQPVSRSLSFRFARNRWARCRLPLHFSLVRRRFRNFPPPSHSLANLGSVSFSLFEVLPLATAVLACAERQVLSGAKKLGRGLLEIRTGGHCLSFDRTHFFFFFSYVMSRFARVFLMRLVILREEYKM